MSRIPNTALRPNNPGSVLGLKQNAFPFSQTKFPQKWSFLQKFQHRYQNILRILNMRSKFVFSIEKAAVEQLRPGSTVCCRTDTSRASTEKTRPVVAQDAAEQNVQAA